MSLPTVLLHDHLDGGLRPETVIELAQDHGYAYLPHTDVARLAAWFDQSESGSLEGYLGAFEHTIGVMQTADSIERVAYEATLDLHADGVVYFETRFSPPQHTSRGLSQGEVIEAVANGLRRGSEETGVRWGMIIDALRQRTDSLEVARLAVDSIPLGVVGFDLAGPEAGHPPQFHIEALRLARESGLRITLHAGEAAGRDGVAFIAAAMDRCGAERIGHGVELIYDCVLEGGDIVKLGPVAERVRDRRIPLEMCPASNLATGRMTAAEHPLGAMHRAGFTVTLNTDNRLMSRTSMSAELHFAMEHHGMSIDDLATVARRSVDAAFASWDTKRDLWESALAPAYIDAGANVEPTWS
jgi:adenosine deaminase